LQITLHINQCSGNSLTDLKTISQINREMRELFFTRSFLSLFQCVTRFGRTWFRSLVLCLEAYIISRPVILLDISH